MASSNEQARKDLAAMLGLAPKQAVGDRSSRMFEVIASMNRNLDPDALFPAAVRKVVELFQAQRGFLMLGSDPEHLRFQTTAAFDGRPIERPEEEVSHAVIRQAAADRKAVLVTNALEDGRFLEISSVHRLELLSVMCAPLMVEEEFIGVVYLDNRALPGAFRQEDLDLLALFADHAAIAIRNAQLFAELKQAQEALLQAERLKALGQLASIVAHEIRTPLSAMKIMSEELPHRLQDQEFLPAFAEIILDEVNRLDGIVEGLLDYARPSQLNFQETSVADVLRAAAALFRSEAEQAGVEIVEEFADAPPAAWADPEKLQQVFCNLIRNAMDAVASQPTKRIVLSLDSPAPTRVRVRVADTGPGIPEEVKKKLFRPFFTTKENGTGLGLAVSSKIVAEHRGSITVDAPAQGGAAFTIVLPTNAPPASLMPEDESSP